MRAQFNNETSDGERISGTIRDEVGQLLRAVARLVFFIGKKGFKNYGIKAQVSQTCVVIRGWLS